MERPEEPVDLGAFRRRVLGCNQDGFAGRDVIGRSLLQSP